MKKIMFGGSGDTESEKTVCESVATALKEA